MAIAIALILLVLGTLLFHFLSPWQLTPLASNWGMIDTTIDITFWVTGVVFVAVNLFLAYVVFRYRYNRNRRSSYEPENKKLEWWLIGITTLGIAALLAPGLWVWASFVSAPEDAHEVEVVAQQWHWSFRFPGVDGELGAVHARFVSDDNPFGMDPDDPRGQDDILVYSPTLRLPVDRPVKLLLRSKDVIHNFQVAQFRGKMDMVPGQVSYIWLTPTSVGEFEILCAELCGLGHFAMRGKVQVLEQDDFDAWLANQPTHAALEARPPGDPVAGQAHYATCVACHGAGGEGDRALESPRLAGMDTWYIRRQLEYFRAGVRGAHPDDTHGAQMRAFAAILPDAQAIEDVAAYIHAMPEVDLVPSVDGNLRRGRRLFRTCGTCHGSEGQGIRAVRAPRLAGLPDWYVERQLANYRSGIRGRHTDDLYGWQMSEMAKILTSEQAIHDVVAYIHTLPGPVATAGDSLASAEE